MVFFACLYPKVLKSSWKKNLLSIFWDLKNYVCFGFEFLGKPNLTVQKKIKYHLENSLKFFLGKIIKTFNIIGP